MLGQMPPPGASSPAQFNQQYMSPMYQSPVMKPGMRGLMSTPNRYAGMGTQMGALSQNPMMNNQNQIMAQLLRGGR